MKKKAERRKRPNHRGGGLVEVVRQLRKGFLGPAVDSAGRKAQDERWDIWVG